MTTLKEIFDEDWGEIFLPLVFYKGHLAALKAGQKPTGHTFGGTSKLACENQHLHCLGDIRIGSIFAEAIDFDDIPLLFPFQYDGGVLEYAYDHRRARVISLAPTTHSADWPYKDYPQEFKTVNLEVVYLKQMSTDEFAELPPQGLDVFGDWQNKVIVIFPEYPKFGANLWNPEGGKLYVYCIFAIDPATRMVMARNQCG